VALPIVGMGGVSHGAHAYDVLDAGATLVAVGTESFRDPTAGTRIARELKSLQIAGSKENALRESEPQVQVDVKSADSR
jgi:dihydroorotate dehydrogenase (NAD+) catalytic subunit